jgi:hypothetical protein
LRAKGQVPLGQQRRTTRKVDSALGFKDVVHFYLVPKAEGWGSLPILGAQLGLSEVAPFPHVALALPTEPLRDEDCTICLWNIAVSRPDVNGYPKGGNWSRGTDPEKIASVWSRFRATQPEARQARGYWNGTALVPTLEKGQIAANGSLFSRAAGKHPELLLRAPVPVGSARLHVFSRDDARSVSRLSSEIKLEVHAFDGYDAACAQTAAWRSQIEAYFTGESVDPPALDFDRVRPRLRPLNDTGHTPSAEGGGS